MCLCLCCMQIPFAIFSLVRLLRSRRESTSVSCHVMYAVGIAASAVCMLVVPTSVIVLCLLRTRVSDLSVWQAMLSSSSVVWMLLFGAWFVGVTSRYLMRSLTTTGRHGECRRLMQTTANTLPTYSALHRDTTPAVSFTGEFA